MKFERIKNREGKNLDQLLILQYPGTADQNKILYVLFTRPKPAKPESDAKAGGCSKACPEDVLLFLQSFH